MLTARAGLALALLGLGSCGPPSAGRIVDARGGTGFAAERDEVLLSGPRGLLRVGLDGSDEQVILPKRARLLDASADGRLYVLGSEDGELYLYGDGAARLVELEVAADDAALSPDGTHLCALPAADKRGHDDAVFLVDTTTLEASLLGREGAGTADRIAWSTGGDAVWVRFAHRRPDDPLGLRPRIVTEEWLPLDGGADGGAPAAAYTRVERALPHGPACRERVTWAHGDAFDGVRLTDAAGGQRLLRVKGRGRAGEWGPPDVPHAAFFSSSCRYAVFDYDGQAWVAEVATGRVGHLGAGEPFPAPRR